ncbi:MAG TPA: hypothetical protein VHP13_03375 [Gammaproteobacteria bacterium]|jgi:hypothetical protein|nr:hypothetical protein [Gammaproteobacteria bacterium]
MRSSIKSLFLCLSLAACTHMDPRLNPQGVLFAEQLDGMTARYNLAHGTDYPAPQLSLDAMPAQPSVIGTADYSAWTIHINSAWLKRNPCLVQGEALPHELAHLFVYYDKYGPPQTVTLNGRRGPVQVAMNGPGLQDLSEEHGKEWQATARALGADPCREGYCYSAKPYKKYPPDCSGSLAAR